MTTLQDRMHAAFDNYLDLSEALGDDLASLLDSESESKHWRRNFIRVTVALIEGHAHCLRDICRVSLECKAPEIANKELKVLNAEWSTDANERIKFTLRAAHKLLELQPAPDFGGDEWSRAQLVFEKRHLLMHPKSISDLAMPEELWVSLRQGAVWLIEQFFNIMAALQKKK